MIIETVPLNEDVIPHIADLAPGAGMDRDDAEAHLRSLSKRHGVTATITRTPEGTIVGSLVTGSLRNWTGVNTPQNRTAIHNAGVDPEKVVLPAYVFVHPNARGQGLLIKMRDNRNEYWKKLGYTHVFIYGYRTESIKNWSDNNYKNQIMTTIVDENGYPAGLTPMQ